MDNSICGVEKKDKCTVLSLKMDRFEPADERNLAKDFFSLVKDGNKNIVLDLSKSEYISSIGIAALIGMLKHTKKEEGSLVICGAKTVVKDVFRMSNIDKIFKMFNDKEEALDLFG